MKNFRLLSKQTIFAPTLVLLLIYQVVVETKFSVNNVGFLSASNEFESSSSDQESSSKSQQEGSWSQWWSYDGISGPEYWNINKRWNLCTLGRKQSPIDIRTERLVYDHLLGPFQLNWISFDQTNNVIADMHSIPSTSAEESQKALKVQLLNSGRGIEAWLEPINSAPIETNSEFIISHGPLSYAYKLFKIELHSASNFASQQHLGNHINNNNHLNNNQNKADSNSGLSAQSAQENQANADLFETEEQVPEALKTGKSSEHLIDGGAFEAELQLHFYNRHLASSSAQAFQLALESRPNLFAAISVFIVSKRNVVIDDDDGDGKEYDKSASHIERRLKQKGHKINSSSSSSSYSSYSHHSPIDFILDNLNVIPNQGNLVELKLTRHHIESLITDHKHYITYQGSMNRPPCAENVDWILLNKAIKVDEFKLARLFEKATTNQENIRPVKALHRRLLRTTISKIDPAFAFEEKHQNSESDCGGNKRNCTANTNTNLHSPNRHNKQTEGGGGGGFAESSQSRQSWCSMKPNYAYQFSYGQQPGKHTAHISTLHSMQLMSFYQARASGLGLDLGFGANQTTCCCSIH